MAIDQNYIILSLMDSPNQMLLVINQHFVYIYFQFKVIRATIRKYQTLGHFWKPLYSIKITVGMVTHT